MAEDPSKDGQMIPSSDDGDRRELTHVEQLRDQAVKIASENPNRAAELLILADAMEQAAHERALARQGQTSAIETSQKDARAGYGFRAIGIVGVLCLLYAVMIVAVPSEGLPQIVVALSTALVSLCLGVKWPGKSSDSEQNEEKP